MTKMRNLNRNVLIALIAGLLILEAGLIWAGARALRKGETATTVPTPSRAGPWPYPTTSAPAGATPAPAETPVVVPLNWQAGPLVAGGDLFGVAQMFDAEEAMGFVEALAAPEFGGRQPGTESGRAAGQYIADRFQEYGLQPAGTDGYFQPFRVPFAEITSVPTFVFTSTAGTVYDNFVYREDFAFSWGGYAGGGEAQGRVLWLNECSPEDFRGADVQGQIAFCKFSTRDEIFRQALEHGASGLILLAEDVGRVDKIRTYRQPNYLPESLPSLIVLPQVAEALLDGSGYTLQDLSILFRSVPLNVSAHFEVFLNEPGEGEARNVLGVLPGADPALRDKVLIIGAHYDHLGTDANGDLYPGAHDDASGVAVLIEIARTWQAAGFVPDTTVLFAAWDSEEQGLLGAVHYVKNPRYPLASTIGMIQLDMVALGSEGVMSLDGTSNAVGRQMMASASAFGVPSRQAAFQGGSDHAPFLQANVPATVLIWDDGHVPYYHTPQDTPETLEPERLRLAGAMASHAAIVLTTLEPRLEALLDSQAQAIAAGNADAYAATLDPEDMALLQAGRDWLATRPVESRQGYTATAISLTVMGDSATANVAASTVDKDGRKALLTSHPVQLVRRGAEWYATWPVSDVITASHITARMVKTDDPDAAWVRSLDGAYAQLAPSLGLSPTPSFSVTVYPDDRTLSWLAGPGIGEYSPLPGIHVSRTAALTPTVTSLILGGMGLPGGQGDWLWAGLNEWAKTLDDAEAQRTQAAQMTPSLGADITAQGVMTRTASAFGVRETATVWSLTTHFLQAYGPDGLRELCGAWGTTRTAEGAFAALSTTPDTFAESWEAAVLRPLVVAREGIDVMLRQREQAVLAGDKAAFLATANPADAVFLTEEEHWFDDAVKHSAETYSLKAEVTALDGESALARLQMTAKLKDSSQTSQASYIARFLNLGDRWVFAGPDWKTAQGEHFLVKYVSAPEESARAILDAAEVAYDQVTADLNYTPASVTEIKFYDEDSTMSSSILLSLQVQITGWYEPGESIKLSPRAIPAGTAGRVWDATLRQWTTAEQSSGGYESRLTSVLAHELTHRALFDLGVTLGWFHEGVSVFEGLRAAPEMRVSAQARYVPVVREAQRTQKLLDWANMPTYDQVQQDMTLLFGQSWMLVDEFARQFGMDALNRLIRSLTGQADFVQAFSDVTRAPFADWEAQWQKTVRLGGTPPELIRWAQGFSADRALDTVRLLASPEYEGRRAGSPGADAAAQWIAEQMAQHGVAPGAPDGTFFQTVPVPYSELTEIPVLRFSNTATGTDVALIFGETFREVAGGGAGGGSVESDLVWLPSGFPEDISLGGRVALKYQTADLLIEADQAMSHGAGGLLLVVKEAYMDMSMRSVPSQALREQTIPVVQIREDTWRGIIKMAGLTTYEATHAPPALVTSLRVHLTVGYGSERRSSARTVIGVLPGTRSDARPLVIGAHYDGIGALPDGTLYPSANKNASGVAVMLEVARVLRESNFEFSRSIYFIAWGAEEPGLASSYSYLSAPAVPLDQMLGLLELDTVGAARSYYLNLEGEKDALETQLLFNLRLAADLLQRRVSPEAYKGGNTHATFRERGVPSVLLFWPTADYIHTPGDVVTEMDPYKLATTGEVAALAVMMMGR